MCTYGYVFCNNSDSLGRQLRHMKSLDIPHENIYADKSTGNVYGYDGYGELDAILMEGDMLYVSGVEALLAIVARNDDFYAKRSVIGSNKAVLDIMCTDIVLLWHKLADVRKIGVCVVGEPLLDTRIIDEIMQSTRVAFPAQIVHLVTAAYLKRKDEAGARQADGISRAVKAGKHYGRPRIEITGSFYKIAMRFKQKDITAVQAAEKCGMSLPTFYRRMKQVEEVAGV